jgi:DNA repair exonuclease SbcCD ATPase subunit
MYLTLEQAAQETGKSKRVISQAIRTEKLPAKKGKKGQWQIDPAALFQVFSKTSPANLAPPPQAPWPPQAADTPEKRIKQLEEEIQQLRQELAQAISPLRQGLTHTQEQLQELKRLLAQEIEELRQLTEQLSESSQLGKRGFWSRWLHRGR